MLRIAMSFAAVLAFATAAQAEPVKLSNAELDGVTAAGTNPYDVISNPAFQPSGRGSIENVHNPALRFGSGGRLAIPGEGGQHASDNSVVAPYNVGGSQSIVAPAGRN